MIPFFRGLHCDPFPQKITGPITNTLWFPCAKDVFVIPFYRRLHCDLLLQRIALWLSSTEGYIAIPFYKGLHCDSLLQRITLRSPSTNDYMYLPNKTNNEYIVVALYTRLRYDSLLQRYTLWSPSTADCNQEQFKEAAQSFADHHIRQNSSKLIGRIAVVEREELVGHTSEERLIYRQACHGHGVFDLTAGYGLWIWMQMRMSWSVVHISAWPKPLSQHEKREREAKIEEQLCTM